MRSLLDQGLEHVHRSSPVKVRFDERTNTVLAIAAEDNLVKGASGQMIQGANIVLGLPETTGLPLLGVQP